MLKLIKFSLIFSLLVSCSTYKVDTEISKSSSISKIKKAGVILRLMENSRIPANDYIRTMNYWLSAGNKEKKVILIKNASGKLCFYTSDADRFFQVTEKRKFLKYKALGVINTYVRSNEEDLKKYISEKSLDGLVIYEIFGIISNEMQFFDFESVVCIFDKNLNVVYIDHQYNSYESNEFSREKMKEHLLDKVGERLVKKLSGLDLLSI